MSEDHLHDLDLAEAGDSVPPVGAPDHLRWCGHCRNAVVEYQWLGTELGGALHAAVHRVQAPSSDWSAVHARVFSGPHLHTGQQRLAVLSSAITVLCLLLIATPALNTTAFALMTASQALAPVPATLASDPVALVQATPVPPAVASVGDDRQETPVLSSAPRPPESGPFDE